MMSPKCLQYHYPLLESLKILWQFMLGAEKKAAYNQCKKERIFAFI